MLYRKEKISDTTLLAIWKLEESKDELYSMLDNKEWLTDIMTIKSEARILEKLAVRVLLKEVIGEEVSVLYRSTNCPYLDGNRYRIGISHTRGYAAVIVDTEHRVAVDIEQISDKVKRIQSRLISETEYIDPAQEVNHLLLHFSAKESMYKAMDAEGVDFIEHLHVMPFTPQRSGTLLAKESRTAKRSAFDIHYTVENDFVLTYLIVK